MAFQWLTLHDLTARGRYPRTRYSVCSSDNPCSERSTGILNFSTGSNGDRPPFQRGGRPSALIRTGRNISKSTVAVSVSRGSPCADISASRSEIDQNPIRPAIAILHRRQAE